MELLHKQDHDMADDNEGRKRVYRNWDGRVLPGQPIQVGAPVEVADAGEPSSLCIAMANALRAYRKAARELLEGQYASLRELAPPHLRIPCHIYVMCCPDGVLVRYDAAIEEEPKLRVIDHHERLADVAPMFSEQVIHIPDDPLTYVPKHDGPGFILRVANEHGQVVEDAHLLPVIFAPRSLPADFKLLLPSERPPCLASLHRELELQMHGVISPADIPARAIQAGSHRFVAHRVLSLPVGWQAIEVYPRLGEEYWQPEYAAKWARLDLDTVIMQRNAVQNALHRLDGLRQTRQHYIGLLEEFEALLAGPEEPCHQFLKSHPELICPSYTTAWSKVSFGRYVSDFVFREPCDDYLLVEIEAPRRKLFRNDGHPRQMLTHAMSQIEDWLSYIQRNKALVEAELGLVGISATPRTLVIIGRSASLTEDNRVKLGAMRTQRPGLSILTYDDLIDRARANLERHLGPMSLRARNLDIYFYREPSATR
jgi:hypothetical protein